jgi:hypothetical protein
MRARATRDAHAAALTDRCRPRHLTLVRVSSAAAGAPAQRDDYASPAVGDSCADAADVVFFDLDDTLIDVNRRAHKRVRPNMLFAR